MDGSAAIRSRGPRSGPRPISVGDGRRAHLVGVCGSGMRALAEYLIDAGWRVSGSDQAPPNRARRALQAVGIRVAEGHDVAHVSRDADLLVYSAAVPESNVERAAAVARGIETVSYPQALGRCMRVSRGVAIAGTHGKTTTTAMLSWILRESGRNPSMICGGEVLGLGRAGFRGDGDLLVVEACEYGRHFLELRPQVAAVLSIEPDHFDSFPDEHSAVDAYCAFLASVPADGSVIVDELSSDRKQLSNSIVSRAETFGVNVDGDWSALNVVTGEERVWFELRHDGLIWAAIELPHPGRHNVANAAAAAALAARLGVSAAEVADGLRTFPGVRRRLEVVGRHRGVLWLDDYAHHPTAVRAALTAARKELGAERVWCAFQPHQVSRTVALMSGFVDALLLADEVLLLPVYAAREPVDVECDAPSKTIAERLTAAGGAARFEPTLDRVMTTLETDPRPGDVVVVLGAGDIERICDEFTGTIQRNHAS